MLSHDRSEKDQLVIRGRQSLAVEKGDRRKGENSKAENQSCMQREETDKEQLAPFHSVNPGLKLKMDGRVADTRGVRPPQLLVQPPFDHLCPCDSCAPPQRGVQ